MKTINAVSAQLSCLQGSDLDLDFTEGHTKVAVAAIH